MSAERDLYVAIAALVDERVAEALSRRGVVALEYRSSAPASRVSGRTHNRWCRSGKVQGARRDGREWVCSAAAWRAARATGPARASQPALRVVPSDDAADLLRAAGMRPTRGSR